jgi:hypothetical protein
LLRGSVLLLGAAVGALLAEGNAKRRIGLGKLKFAGTEKKRSKEILKKSKKSRGSGYLDFVMAVLLFLMGIVIAVVIVYAPL